MRCTRKRSATGKKLHPSALVAALAVGLTARRMNLVGGTALLPLKRFAFDIAATVVLALLAWALGWIEIAT